MLRLSAADPGELPHVLLVVDQFPKTLGGGERVVLRLANLLPQYGFRASLLTFFLHPESPAPQNAPCPIRVIPLHRTWDLTAIRGVMELRRFIKRERVQIVQTFFESSDIWAGVVTKALSDAKLVWSRRDMGILRSRKHHFAYRLLAGLPDAVLCVSEQVRQHCIIADRVNPSKIHTIYNGIDLSRWNSSSPKRVGNQLVTTVGNIRRVKGHDVLVRAAAIVARHFPDVRFRVMGEVLEPEYFRELQNLVHELGLNDRVIFVSGVHDLRPYLADSDVFVLPSRSEGFSNALIEAMAAALPVVATEVGGNAEAVKEGENGYLVAPEDPNLLADRILRLLNNPVAAKAMGIKGRRLAAERFSVESMMDGICCVYRSLLKG